MKEPTAAMQRVSEVMMRMIMREQKRGISNQELLFGSYGGLGAVVAALLYSARSHGCTEKELQEFLRYCEELHDTNIRELWKTAIPSLCAVEPEDLERSFRHD